MQNAITLPFSFDSSGLVAHTSDEKKIWQDRVVLAVMTRLGERVMRPGFGSEVPSLAFESSSTAATLIRQAVASVFSRWLSSLTLEGVTFTSDPIDYSLIAQINYRYGPTAQIETVKLKTAILTRAGEVISEAE